MTSLGLKGHLGSDDQDFWLYKFVYDSFEKQDAVGRSIITRNLGHVTVQGDQLYMAVCFWYLVNPDLSSERYFTVAYTSATFWDGTRTSRPCLSGRVVRYHEKLSTMYLDIEGDIEVGIWAALVEDIVALSRHI